MPCLPSETGHTSYVETLCRTLVDYRCRGGHKPLHAVRIDDTNLEQQILNAVAEEDACHSDGSAIVVCADRDAADSLGTLIADTYDATMAAMLTGWNRRMRPHLMRAYPDTQRMEELRRLLNLPRRILPFAVIGMRAPRTPLAEGNRRRRIHSDTWEAT